MTAQFVFYYLFVQQLPSGCIWLYKIVPALPQNSRYESYCITGWILSHSGEVICSPRVEQHLLFDIQYFISVNKNTLKINERKTDYLHLNLSIFARPVFALWNLDTERHQEATWWIKVKLKQKKNRLLKQHNSKPSLYIL